MAVTRQCALLLVSLAAAACASRGSANPGAARWSGSFRQMARTAALGAEISRARASGYGTITITPVADQAGRVRVDLSVSTSVSSTQIAWALFQGPCNTPTPPVIAANEFPMIEVGSSGAGTVRAEMPMTLDTRATYHANVYWSGRATDVSNVMLCANLTYGGG